MPTTYQTSYALDEVGTVPLTYQVGQYGYAAALDFPMAARGVLADIDFDFQNGRYYQAGQGVDPLVLTTTSRASTAYADNLAGEWSAFLSNVPRITNKGLLVEETRTNVVLWNRDLTNVAWTASNVTVAKDQTGIDGTATSASSLTATAGNGTVLQAITLASSARFQSAFVKRITGSGVVNMTMDNGATWTAVTVTSVWTRVAIPTQTLANPTVGFRIVTSGDAIAVDFVQNENNSVFATSPILVTTVAVARAADVVTVTTPPIFGASCTLFGRGTPVAPITLTAEQDIISINDGTNNNNFRLLRNATTGAVLENYRVGAAGATASSGSAWATSASGKVAAAGASGDQAVSFNGASVGVNTFAGSLGGVANVVNIGTSAAGAVPFRGYVERVALWSTTRLSNADLQRITR